MGKSVKLNELFRYLNFTFRRQQAAFFICIFHHRMFSPFPISWPSTDIITLVL